MVGGGDGGGFESQGEHGGVEVGEGGGGFAADVGAEACLEVHEDVDDTIDGDAAAEFVVLFDGLDGAVEELEGTIVEGDDELDAVGALQGLLLVVVFHG